MQNETLPLLENEKVETVLQHQHLSHFIYLGLIALSMAGDIIGDYFPRESRFYWVSLVVIFAISTFTLEAAKIKQKGISGGMIFKIQATHWLGTVLAVLTVFFLTDQQLISPYSSGLIIHIVLALSTFLYGLHLGWKFYLLGILLFLLAILAAYDIGFFSQLLILIIPIILLGIYYEERSVLPTLKKRQ